MSDCVVGKQVNYHVHMASTAKKAPDIDKKLTVTALGINTPCKHDAHATLSNGSNHHYPSTLKKPIKEPKLN